MCLENENFCSETQACEYVENQIKEITASIDLKNYKKYHIWVEKDNIKKDITEKECETGILTHTTIVTGDNEHYTAYFRVC